MASNQNMLSIFTLCEQRRKEQLLNVPPSREELQSPYETTNFTKFQLDMRRKAEVLKYNNGNTKTNTLTKNQRWAQLVNGNAPKTYIKGNVIIETEGLKVISCNGNAVVSSSSAAGVPKDIHTGVNSLFYDPAVILYNYQNPVLTRSYGVINGQEPTDPILYTNYMDVYTPSDTYSKITTIQFTSAAQNSQYSISLLNIPLAIEIYGKLSGTNVRETINSIRIHSFSSQAYFNDNLVTTNNDVVYSFLPNNLNDLNYTLDISTNTNINGTSFSGTQYIGLLSISNIVLTASPGYIYDIGLVVDIGKPLSYSHVPSIGASLISNVSSSYLSQHTPHNCTIRPTTSISGVTLGTFQVTAV